MQSSRCYHRQYNSCALSPFTHTHTNLITLPYNTISVSVQHPVLLLHLPQFTWIISHMLLYEVPYVWHWNQSRSSANVWLDSSISSSCPAKVCLGRKHSPELLLMCRPEPCMVTLSLVRACVCACERERIGV